MWLATSKWTLNHNGLSTDTNFALSGSESEATKAFTSWSRCKGTSTRSSLSSDTTPIRDSASAPVRLATYPNPLWSCQCCPLLITAGHCARFCYRELEYPADFRLLRRHQETIFVCIYLCGQFLKSPQSRLRKLSEIQSTPQNNHCQHLWYNHHVSS